jgi:mono/diheme cytochrome c family protein
MKYRWLALVTFLSVGLAACSLTLAEDITPPPGYLSPTPPPTTGPLYPPAPPSPQRGAALYLQDCQPCHGEKGLGNGPLSGQMPVSVPSISLREVESQFTPADWYTLVSQGNINKGMPPFTSLTPQERWDVLSYVYSLGVTSDQIQHGAAVYADQCASCHGIGGRGDGPQAAGLSPAPKDFTDRQYMSLVTDGGLYRSIADGVAPGMKAFADQLSADDIWALVSYLRSLTLDQSALVAQSQPSPTPVPATETLPAPSVTQLTSTPGSGTPAAVATVPGAAVGTVTGKVVAASASGLPAGLTVSLRGFDHDPTSGTAKEAVTLSMPLPAEGAYQFDRVDMPAGRIFFSQVDYNGVPFQSDTLTASAGTSALDLPPITVYETTQDLNVLKIEQVHIVADFSSKGVVQMVEIYVMTNPSQQAVVVPSDGTSIPFVKVPPEASGVTFQLDNGSAPFLGTGNGFAMPPVSGDQKYALVVLFNLPYPGKLELTLPFALAVDAETVLVPEGVTVRGSQLTDVGIQTIQSNKYHTYNASSLAAGQSLSMTISGAPGAASSGTNASRPLSLMIGIGAFGLVLIAAGVYLYLRDRTRKDEEEEEAEEEVEQDALGNDPDRIADAIIVLDDQFKAGELTKEAYQARRAILKERLRKSLE